MERTLIIVRRALTVPKAIFAGSIPDKSFAKFKASMAIFKVERVVSPPLSAVEVLHPWSKVKVTAKKRVVRRAVRKNLGLCGSGRQFGHEAPRANGAT